MQENKIYLNGEWDFMPLYNVKSCLQLPEQIEYDAQKIRVPSSWATTVKRADEFTPYRLNDYPEKWNEARTAVYHRTFTLDKDLIGQSVFLNISSVMQRLRIYLNGKYISDWDDSYLPCRKELTDDLVWDKENHLQIVVTEYENVIAPSGETEVLNPPGCMTYNALMGILDDVYLDIVPKVRVDDITVRTWVRGMKWETILDISNDTNEHRRLQALATVYDGDSPVKTLTSEPFTAVSYGTQTVLIEDVWEDAILWDIDQPHLYRMEVSLYDGQTLLHCTSCRFGFREFWHEGIKFFLNGKRINLRGDSYHFHGPVQTTRAFAENWYKMCKENGANYVRLHANPYPSLYLDVADEMGMLIVDETALCGSNTIMASGDSRYIERCQKHISRFVQRDRNHPSVILWSLENEHYGSRGVIFFKEHLNRFVSIAHKMDPTRLSYFEGDRIILPEKDTILISDHYSQTPLSEWVNTKKKPLIVGEHSSQWNLHAHDGAFNFGGPDAYLDIEKTMRAISEKEKIFIETARREEVSAISTYNMVFYNMFSMPDEDVLLEFDSLEGPGNKPMKIPRYSLTMNNGYLKDYPAYRPCSSLANISSAYKPVTIIPQEYNSQFFDDKPVERTYNVYNDTRHDQNCLIKYEIFLGDKLITSDEIKFHQPVAERYDWKLTLPHIAVKEKSEMKLIALLYHDQVEMHRFEKVYTIYPSTLKTTPIGTKKHICYWGNDDGYEIISALLPGCERIDDFASLNEQYDVVIIGPHMPCWNVELYRFPLLKFIKEKHIPTGGAVIQFEQSLFNIGYADLKNDFPCNYSAYTSIPNHPVLQGLSDRDFIYWKPDIVEESPDRIIKSHFVKNNKIGSTYILECGSDHTPLFEYTDGRSRIIMNQMELFENFDTVPQAAILLRNILKYSLNWTHLNRSKTGKIVADTSNAFFDKAGLQADDNVTEFDDFDQIVIDMKALPKEQDKQLTEYLEKGGKVLFLPITEQEADRVSKILGQTVTVEECETYQLKLLNNTDTDYGISKYDLFQYIPNTIIAKNSLKITEGIELMHDAHGTPWHDYYVNGYHVGFCNRAIISINLRKQAEEKTYMAEVNVGKGKAILSQICLDDTNDKNIRIYAQILSNMRAWYVENKRVG